MNAAPRPRTPSPPGADATTPALAALLETQFRLMSFDIRRPEGNLLLELGFARRRAPSGRLGASQYLLAGEPEARLWGFGLLLRPRRGQPACMLLRSGRALLSRRPAPTDVWDPMRAAAQLELEGACPEPLLLDAVRWLAGYERQVISCTGLAHRVRARAACTHACPAHTSLAAEWARWLLARRV